MHPAAIECRQPPLQNTSRPRFDGAYPSINLSVYERIRTYTHVYACICMYMCIYACMHIYAHICMYIYSAQVNECICMYMPYMHVYCKYMHVTPYNTGIDATSPNHSPSGHHQAGPTQGTPGHMASQLIRHRQHFADPISGTTPQGTPPGPLLHPPGSSGKPPTP